MPEYVLNRNYLLQGKGHSINFAKGQPTWVPPSMEIEAAKIGAEPVSGDKPDVLGPEEVAKPEAPVGLDRVTKLREVFELLDAEGERDTFNAQGFPTNKSVERLFGFPVSKKEIDAEYRTYKQDKAAQLAAQVATE